MKNLLIITTMFATSLLFANTNVLASDCGSSKEAKNIVQIAQDAGFSSLAAALTKADLVDALQEEGSFTVFAPTNEAFTALLNKLGVSSLDDIPVDQLKQVLLYHVVNKNVMSKDITDGSVKTLQGTSINLTTSDGIQVNGVNVINPYDVEASNGVIHVIDNVLLPTE